MKQKIKAKVGPLIEEHGTLITVDYDIVFK